VDGSTRHFPFQIDIISILFWDFTYPAVNMSYIKTVDLSKEDREELRTCRRVRVVKSSVLWRDFYIFSSLLFGEPLGDAYYFIVFLCVYSVFPSILGTGSWLTSSVLAAACLADCFYENGFLSY